MRFDRSMNTALTSLAAPDSIYHDADHCVTASDLVRHFGIWQDRAARAPVYILHRGRARHVLTSIDLMQALCAPHASDTSDADQRRLLTLLTMISDLCLLIDDGLRVTAASTAAQQYLAGDMAPGTPLARLAHGVTAKLLADAAHRVLATGHAEQVEFVAARYPGRRLDCQLRPFPGGLALIARDASLADDLATEQAQSTALGEAMVAQGRIATARLNLRGYVEGAAPALAGMTGLDGAALASVRFVALLDIGSRVTAGAAIEQALTDRTPIAFDAKLLVNRSAPLPVRIGVAPLRDGTAPVGAMLAIAAVNDD